MSLIVDEQNELHEVSVQKEEKYPYAVRLSARIVSVIFHPLFIPFYLSLFIIRIQPWIFGGLDNWNRVLLLIHVFVMYTLFPAVTVGLLKALGFIGSIQLRTRKDRIIPYIACGIFYFWAWYVSRNLPEYPKEIVSFRFAIFLASSLGLFVNIYMKVSMHAIAMGLATAFLVGFALQYGLSFGLFIAVSLFLTGLVCSARLVLSNHTQGEIYMGLFLGILSQMIGFWM
jgi:hypothetical protein